MLHLDHLQRAQNPIGNTLAARLHLAAAEELRCPPVAEAAGAVLANAGAADAATPRERLAIEFARQATRAAQEIDDRTFAELVAAFGAERTVGIVHTVAYANFLCRIVHGLGVTVPFPIAAAPDDAIPLPKAPARTQPDHPATPQLGQLAWSAAEWKDLRAAQRQQQERAPRIPPPSEEQLAKLTPREQQSAARIVWSRIAYGYQPELTRAWFRCLYTFDAEAELDDVFTNSLFWVVTRTKDCFY